jgi:hypothetical protein
MVWWTVMLWWLIVCTKANMKNENFQIGKHLGIHRRFCEHGNFASHVANSG